MTSLADLSDRGIMRDKLIRFGIRRLDKNRLQAESRRNIEDQSKALFRFIETMCKRPIAIDPQKPNRQPYEINPAFFQNRNIPHGR